MSRPIGRIKCPYHSEETASFVLYSSGKGYCYGCGKQVGGLLYKGEIKEEEPEDVEASIRSIHKLPLSVIRGLSFHCDTVSYYVLWPGHAFYKRRFLSDDGPRYQSPRGIQQPLYFDPGKLTDTLIIVEGEINAASIKLACPDLSVCSPGGVTQLFIRTGSAWRKHLSTYKKFKTIYVLVDDDTPGRNAGVGLVGTLRGMGIETYLRLMETDANDILQHQGIDALRQTIEGMVLQEGVRSHTGDLPAFGGSSTEATRKA